MSPLGEHFPSEMLRHLIESKLKPGCVLRLEVKFPKVTKPKFLILVAEDDHEYLTFIVNSEIHRFIQNQPSLLRCQVSIDAGSHHFLDYDSHVDCNQIWSIKREEVIHELMENLAGIQGEISEEVRSQIIAAVKFAKTIETDKKNRIIAALDS